MMCRGRTGRFVVVREPRGRAAMTKGRQGENSKRMIYEKGVWRLRVVPPPVGFRESLCRGDDRADAIRAEPGDEGCERDRWK